MARQDIVDGNGVRRKATTVWLRQESHRRLKAIAAEQGTTLSALMDEAIERFVKACREKTSDGA
jgi:predicted DNA-binding protein